LIRKSSEKKTIGKIISPHNITIETVFSGNALNLPVLEKFTEMKKNLRTAFYY
jgi:hypothetical protein